MKKTKIEWCDATWNPVTGCFHGCEYCYARRIAKRFGGCDEPSTYWMHSQATWKVVDAADESGKKIFEVDEKCPPINIRFDEEKQVQVTSKAPYPWEFSPTLRRDRMDWPQRWTRPRTIFVCSMADLFGDWVPDEWIEEVFAACGKAPQHRYLFLTKNPTRYWRLNKKGKLPEKENFWYGITATTHQIAEYGFRNLPAGWRYNFFLSIEPLLGSINLPALRQYPKWVIIGAMTGPGSAIHQPKRAWIHEIVIAAEDAGISVYMKDSLLPLLREYDMLREFPWERMKENAD